MPDVLALRQSGIGVAVGALGALLITRVAAGLAARKAAKARLGEALGEAEELPGTLGPVRRIAAAVCVAGAVSCGSITLFMSPENAAATGGGTALAGALACALVAPRLIERLAAKVRFTAFPDQLAVLNVRARAHRNAALVIPVILVASVALANVYQQTTQADAVEHARGQDVAAARARSRAPAGSSTPSTARIASTRGRCSPPTASRTSAHRQHRRDPGQDRRAVGDTIGMVLGDGAHVRLKVAKVLDGIEPQPLDPPADRPAEGPYERAPQPRPAPGRRLDPARRRRRDRRLRRALADQRAGRGARGPPP